MLDRIPVKMDHSTTGISDLINETNYSTPRKRAVVVEVYEVWEDGVFMKNHIKNIIEVGVVNFRHRNGRIYRIMHLQIFRRNNILF